VKTPEREGVGARSLPHNTSGVEGRAEVPRWGVGRLISKSISQTNLHKLSQPHFGQVWG